MSGQSSRSEVSGSSMNSSDNSRKFRHSQGFRLKSEKKLKKMSSGHEIKEKGKSAEVIDNRRMNPKLLFEKITEVTDENTISRQSYTQSTMNNDRVKSFIEREINNRK